MSPALHLTLHLLGALLPTAQAQSVAGLELAEVHTRTADVRALQVQGEVVLAATEGGLEFYSVAGERLGHVVQELPGSSLLSIGMYQGELAVGAEFGGAAIWNGQGFDTLVEGGENATGSIVAITQDHWVTRGGSVDGAPELEGLVVDAVQWSGGLVVGTQEGFLHQIVDGEVLTSVLPCPIVDLYAETDLVRVACMVGAYTLTPSGDLIAERVRASAAGPGAWGSTQGELWVDGAVLARVPHRITAIERVGEVWFVGTEQGLYRIEQDLALLTPEGQICGNFVTGAARFQGELVVSTFQDGACRFDGESWHRIEGLPSELMNDVVVYEDAAWFATGHGLARWDGERVEAFPGMPWGIPRGEPGTSNAAITALAVGSERLWIADVVGPDSVEDGFWRRHRLSVFGTSYQAAAACGERAWVASEDAGVSQWTGRSWQHHDARGDLPDDWVMAVACEGKTAWAGTYRDGLWKYTGGGWTQVETPDGWSLSLARGEGGVWYGTLGGVWFVGDDGVNEAVWVMDQRVHQVSVLESEVVIGTEGGLVVYR